MFVFRKIWRRALFSCNTCFHIRPFALSPKELFFFYILSGISCLKVVSTTFLLVCFLSWKGSTCETRKNVFISLQKLFSFSRKSNFRILDILVSLRHQVPKHKTRNTFFWLTWEITQSVNEIWPVHVISQKKKIYQKIPQKICDAKTSSRPFWACKKLSTTLLENDNFEASYLY